jgi:hypothetical protein
MLLVIEQFDATANVQASPFSQPANQPQIRPYRGPAVTVAQW